MLKSMKAKIIVPTVAILISLIVAIVIYTSVITRNMVEDFADERMAAATQSVQAYLEALEQQVFISVSALASSADLIEFINTNDRRSLINYLLTRIDFLDVNAIVVTDANGYALVRTTMPDVYGDQIGSVPNIAAALRGEHTTMISTTPAVPIVLTATSPIYHEGTLIAGVVVNYDIGEDWFLDKLQGLFEVDVTVFSDYTSVASTIIHPETGQRAVGTSPQDHVIDAVLRRGESMSLTLDIFGAPYRAYYFPLRGIGDSIVGMFFIGISQEASLAIASSMQLNLALMGLVGLIAAAIIMSLVASKLTRPVKQLVEIVDNVSQGKLNLSIDRSSVTKDEIGGLTNDIYDLVNIIKNLVDDMNQMYEEYIKIGNLKYRIDEDRYQNSFKELVGKINNLTSNITTDITELGTIMSNIGNGNFDVELDQNVWVGDWNIFIETTNTLTSSIKFINSQINGMIEAITDRGDLSFRADASNSTGDWVTILEGLNRIAEAINEPIKMLEIAMKEMQIGNYNLDDVSNKIISAGLSADSQTYKGSFKKLALAFDLTLSDTSGYIEEISKNLEAISHGNLTVQITRDFKGNFNAIKDSINVISSTLNKTMSEISSSSDQVLSGAKQISISAQELANGAQQQASSVEELNATIDMINQQTRRNAESAMEATELSKKSTSNAQEGNNSMKDMLMAMSQIKESSNEISKIIKAIQDIAFQTNLLALNAAVEAARAGEHGKGFSVVSEEVRSLAGRSQESATETTNLIETSINRVESGSSIAESTSHSLDAIVKNAAEVSALISNISVASKEQAEAVAQVSEGLSQISKITQSNSAVSEETAAASQELNSQAELLRQLVAYFKI